MKEITYNPNAYRIEITFPFSFGMKNKVKEIPDVKFDWDERVWYLPPTKMHAKFASEFGREHQFFVDKYILELSRITQKKNNTTRSKLYPFQKEGLDFLHNSGGRALLCDSPGCGKTYQTLAYMQESSPSKVLIVSPASVCYMWQGKTVELLGWSTEVVEGYTKEFDTNARVIICSYNVFTNRVYELKELGFSLVVYDECFPAGTLVDTDRGKMKIEDIVNNKLDLSVMSCNLKGNAVEYKKVTGWIKKPLFERLVKVYHERGSLVCTENHPIYTEELGYVKAIHLSSGSTVRILQENVHNQKEGEEHSEVLFSELCTQDELGKSRIQTKSSREMVKATNSKALSVVWKRVLFQIKGATSQRQKKVLFSQLFGSTHRSEPRKQKEICGENPAYTTLESWAEKSSNIRENEEEQSDEQPRDKSKGSQSHARKNILISWWERNTYKAADIIALHNRGVFRVSNRNPLGSKTVFQFPTQQVCSGHWASGVSASNRSGREDTPNKEVEVLGQKEGRNTIPSRVVGVEVYQQGYRRQPTKDSTSYTEVYCLDVEDNHNFFADGVLVHNCHALSNMKSKRSKASRILMTESVIGLSGTPFLNRPVELYPLLNLIQPHVWSNFWKYVHRYCDARKDYFGHWDFKGATNLGELKSRLEHIMLRRTKDDVLKDLPAVTKTYLPYLPQEQSLVKTYQQAYEVAKAQPSNVSPRVRILEMRKVIGLMKVKPAIELAEDILVDNGKVVLFAIHKDVVAQLEEGLEKYNVVKIVGDTPQKDRNDIVNQFQTDPEVRVVIISEAGGEGINLFAASNLIFVEREWNPGKETQIVGRCHRIGQTQPVQVYYIIAKNTIDERIHRLIEKKAEVLGQVYSFEDLPVNDLFDVGVN